MHSDGHVVRSAVVLYRQDQESAWCEAVMRPLVNDRWQGQFDVESLGFYFYTVQGWVDAFQSWSRDTLKKFEAGLQIIPLAILWADSIPPPATPRTATPVHQ